MCAENSSARLEVENECAWTATRSIGFLNRRSEVRLLSGPPNCQIKSQIQKSFLCFIKSVPFLVPISTLDPMALLLVREKSRPQRSQNRRGNQLVELDEVRKERDLTAP
jgi:hypothetical protein